MLMALASGRGVVSFTLTDKPGRMDGQTRVTGIRGLGVSTLLIGFAGYATPSLLGLGGAYMIAHGNSRGVLWVAIVLLAALLLTRKNALAGVITGLALAGVFWAAIAGTPTIQAAVAVGLVWLMLIGGLRDTIADGADAGDAHALQAGDVDPAHRLGGALVRHRAGVPLVRHAGAARFRLTVRCSAESPRRHEEATGWATG